MIILGKADKEKVTAAIRYAEMNTRAEIVVHVQPLCLGDPLKSARGIFKKLGMQSTRERNAVLIFAALGSHKFAVFGDEAIDRAAGQSLWNDAAAVMAKNFSQGRAGDALAGAVARIGQELARFFPSTGDNPDELPNTISEGK